MESNKIARVCGNKPVTQLKALCSVTPAQEDALIKLIGRQRIDTINTVGMTSQELVALDALYKRLVIRKRLCARLSAN